MYCPKCGQQQVSEELRFCSRCGLPLRAVSELIADDGALMKLETGMTNREPTPRQIGIRRGAKMTLAGLVMIPAGYGLCFVFNSGVPVVIPITFFLMGLAWMFYFRLFGDTYTSTLARPASNL